MNQIRILMVDDHTLFRESLSRLLQTTPDFRVAGQCSTVAEARAPMRSSLPELRLLSCHVGFLIGGDLSARGRIVS